MSQKQVERMAADCMLQKHIADKGLFKAAMESAVKDGVIHAGAVRVDLSRAWAVDRSGLDGRAPEGAADERGPWQPRA